jgi:hypothetical protein
MPANVLKKYLLIPLGLIVNSLVSASQARISIEVIILIYRKRAILNKLITGITRLITLPQGNASGKLYAVRKSNNED